MLTAKPATVKSYVIAIRSFHLENGFPITIFDDPRIDLVIRGGKRVYGEGVKKLRLPLTSSVLLRIVNEVRVSHYFVYAEKRFSGSGEPAPIRSLQFLESDCFPPSPNFRPEHR